LRLASPAANDLSFLPSKPLLPLAAVGWPVAAGTLGVRFFLPALADLDTIGAYAFFIAWQATYAAALAHVPARKR